MNELSAQDLDQTRAQIERQIRLSGAIARVRGAAPAQPLGLAAAGPPDFPPDPDLFKAARILVRYGEEAILRAPDFGGFSNGLIRLLTTPAGQKLIQRLQDAILHHKDDPKLFEDLLKALGGSLAGYGSLQFGLATEAHAGAGIVAETGVALPLKEGKVKWFSGMEKSGGLILEAGVNLLIGQKIEAPQHLSGQFYGGHAAIHVGVGLGLNIYFDTSDRLEYTGFSYSVGIGAGFGVSVLSGFEIVTSD